MGLTCLPATKLFKQANHRLLRKSKVTSPSSHYTACPPQCLLVHAAPEYSLHVALRGLQHPALLGCEHMWRINWCQSHLPSVRYQAFSHFRLFRAEDRSFGGEQYHLPPVQFGKSSSLLAGLYILLYCVVTVNS